MTTAVRPAKVACEHCASPVQVEPPPATYRHTGLGVTVYLCERCRSEPGRTWRLRYAPEGEQ
jgi:hypothetical protein